MKDVSPPPSRPKPAALSRDAAESLAIEALSFLAEDRARIERFLALAGLGPADLRAAAASPGFLAAVLDHLASEEDLLLVFAHGRGLDPQAIARARQILSPGTE